MSGEIADDMQLIRRAATDRDAFGELYERHVRRIYSYIYYRTGNHHDAEDLTARVFQRALGHIADFQDQGVPFSAWLYRIAHNLVANWHRDESRRKTVALDPHTTSSLPSDHPEEEALVAEERDDLLAAISRLPPDRQQLLILKFVERLSNAEVGQIMGRSEGAIKSLFHRTLRSLRGEIDRAVGEAAMGREESKPRSRR